MTYTVIAHVDPEGGAEVVGRLGWRDSYRAVCAPVARASACVWTASATLEDLQGARRHVASQDGFWRVYVLTGDDCLSEAKARVMAEYERRSK